MPDTVETAIYKMSVQGQATVDQAAAALDRMAVSEERVDKVTRTSTQSLERMLARLDPNIRAEQQLQRAREAVARYSEEGIGTETQRAQIIDLATARYNQQVGAINKSKTATDSATKSIGLQRYELINLSRQIQDVGVSLASGQSPFTVLVQQGSQVADVFASSEGTVGGFFKQTLSWLGKIFTPARLAAGGIAAIGIAAVTAASQWGAAQRQIAQALNGTGRASGLTVGGVNQIASAGSSTFGLSVSEARELATALAATGKVGKDNIGQIVGLGHDVATALGVDATKATQMLAKAFADPVKGAEELNERLGFLDAATQRQIKSLSDQNRLYEAQQVLITAAKSSLSDFTQNVSTSTKFWTALGNAMSNAWDKFSAGASRATGIGFTEGLDEQIARVRANIEQLQNRPRGLGVARNIDQRLAAERVELEKLTAQWQKYQQSVEDAQQRRDSFAARNAVTSALPEIDELQGLVNMQDLLSRKMIEVQLSGGEQSKLLKEMNLTYKQLTDGLASYTGRIEAFKSANQQTIAGLQLSIQSVGARSPQALGNVAFQQSLLNQRSTSPQATEIANLEKTLTIRQATQQIVDAQRERLLTAKQATEQASLELGLVGKSSVEQDRQRAILQVKNQLEQDALRTYGSRDAYDQKHLQALTDEINKQAQIKQTLAERQALSDITFDRSQIGRSTDEQQIATRLRSIYGDDFASQMNGAIAIQMRFNQQLQFTHDTAGDALKGFVSDLRAGKSASEAFGNALDSMLTKVTNKLIDMAMNNLWNSAFGGSGIGLGNLLSFGGSGTSAGNIGGTGGLLGALHHGGHGPGDAIRATRYIHPAYFDDAPRFHTGIGPGERPAIIRNDESVLTPGQMRQLTPAGAPVVAVNIINQSNAKVEQRQNSGGGVDVFIRDAVQGVIANDAQSNGPISRTMAAKLQGYGGR
jgi:phage-related minor tail protein